MIRNMKLNRYGILLVLCGLCVWNMRAQQKPLLKNDSVGQWSLVFEEEFEGNSVDWNLWRNEYLPGLKHGSYSQPQNAEVKDGELRLYIRKESVNGSTWTAASIFLAEPIKPYTYIECRMKPAQCTGVNNAFWMANRSKQTTTWKNRCEIDMVETRYDTTKHAGNAHIGWHDWKAQPYLKNSKGRNDHVAQGKIIYHDYEDYQTWGIYFKESDYVIYFEGEPVWDGKTHHIYPQQYYTGLGRFKDWFEPEGRRAYGKWGQDDWNYQAGYSGDNLNVILTAYTWPEKWSPITDDAADTYMAVDWVRMYRPSVVMNTQPEEEYEKVRRAVILSGDYTFDSDANSYFSAVVEKKDDTPLEFTFVDDNGAPAFSAGIDPHNQLFIHWGDRISHTNVAYPAVLEKRDYVEPGKKYLMVLRATAHSAHGKFDRDGVSLSVYPLDGTALPDEPYFYPNVDSLGNTSINAGWQLNARNYSDAGLKAVQIRGNWAVSDFKAGRSYKSVIPADWHKPTAALSGVAMVEEGETASAKVVFTGSSPWRLEYQVNGENKVLENIKYKEIALTETVTQNTKIVLNRVTDASGLDGFVEGSASLLLNNKKNKYILPVFDTYVQPEQDEFFSARRNFELKGDPRFERQIYMTFRVADLPDAEKYLFYIYCARNEKEQPMTLSLQQIEGNISTRMMWFNKPADGRCREIGKMEVGAQSGSFIGMDITEWVKQRREAGESLLNLRLVYYDGEKTNLLVFPQGHEPSGKNAPRIVYVK